MSTVFIFRYNLSFASIFDPRVECRFCRTQLQTSFSLNHLCTDRLANDSAQLATIPVAVYFIVPLWFLKWKIRVTFPGESQLRQSRATHPTVHTGCFGISIIHRTLTWTTGSVTCAQMFMHAIAHGGVRTYVRESALLKVDSEREIPRGTGESNLPHRHLFL